MIKFFGMIDALPDSVVYLLFVAAAFFVLWITDPRTPRLKSPKDIERVVELRRLLRREK